MISNQYIMEVKLKCDMIKSYDNYLFHLNSRQNGGKTHDYTGTV